MVIDSFPPIDLADESGLLAFGGDLEIDSLLNAYNRGIFPWPISAHHPIAWFSPDPRGVIYCDQFKVNRTLKKSLNKPEIKVTINQHFAEIIYNCANVKRTDENDTWITAQLMEAYINLHNQGNAYSIEVHDENDLIGGLYGVNIGGYVTAESMFYFKSNGSKIALAKLVEVLTKNNIEWFDTQMITPVVKSLGGQEVPRDKFIEMVDKKKNLDIKLF